jgi:hypothetical protein
MTIAARSGEPVIRKEVDDYEQKLMRWSVSMLKPIVVVTGMVTLISGASLAQTTAPPTSPPPASGSRAIGPAPRTSEPVTPGTSTTPGTERPNNAQKSLDAPSSGGGGSGK